MDNIDKIANDIVDTIDRYEDFSSPIIFKDEEQQKQLENYIKETNYKEKCEIVKKELKRQEASTAGKILSKYKQYKKD